MNCFVIDFFHSACIWDSSMLLCIRSALLFIAEWYSVVWVYHGCSLIYLLIDIWGISRFWLEWMKLLWAFILWIYVFILLGEISKRGLKDHIVYGFFFYEIPRIGKLIEMESRLLGSQDLGLESKEETVNG